MKSTEYREQLAKTFINCLQEKQLSWKKEWKASNSQAPYNAVTGKQYKGINHLALGLTAMAKKYQDPRLVAEMSSCFMATELSVEQEMTHIDNHKAYVQGWIQAIQDKPEILVKAVKEASECADFLAYKAELISEQEYRKEREAGMDIKVKDNPSLSQKKTDKEKRRI